MLVCKVYIHCRRKQLLPCVIKQGIQEAKGQDRYAFQEIIFVRIINNKVGTYGT